MATPPGPPPALGTTTKTSGTTDYLGDVPHARLRAPSPVHIPFGNGTIQVNGYKKGDQVSLLPSNGADLSALQQALYQAGYFTDAQYQRLVLGSPDQVTTAAFAKLLATANMSGVTWKDALASRLATSGQQAPATRQVPPLTISLTNPDDIKAVAQNAAQTLNGTYMNDAQLNSFIQAYQAQERAYQTQQYNQQYDPAAGTYGPGGETTAPATGSGLEQEIADQIRQAKPDEVAANAFTAHLNTLLSAATQNASAPRLTA